MRLALLLLVGCYTSGGAPVEPAKPPPPRHARATTDPLAFLPIDSEVVASLDTVQLRGSTLWPKFEMALRGKTAVLDQFRAACGFDLLSMVKRLTVGMRDLDAPKPQSVLVIRGVERMRMMLCAEKSIAADPGSATIEQGIVTLHTSDTAFAFADATTLVLVSGNATREHVREVLDSGSPLRGSEAFTDLYGRIEPTKSAWFFINGTSKFAQTAAAIGVKMHALFGSFDVSQGVGAKLVLRVDDEPQAQNLVTMLQPQIGAVKSMVEKLEVTSDGPDVLLDAQLSDEQASLLVNVVLP